MNQTMKFAIIFSLANLLRPSKGADVIPGCCSFPCENRGVCVETGNDGADYWCDCGHTGFYGDRCEIPFWKTWLKNLITPSRPTISHIMTHPRWKFLWDFVNQVEFLQDALMRYVYLSLGEMYDFVAQFDSNHDYVTSTATTNKSFYGRILPPVGEKCPTPLGTIGKPQLPPIKDLTKLFERKRFRPSQVGTNALFFFFAQHFTHQFFKSEMKLEGTQRKLKLPFTYNNPHVVDLNNIYGDTTENQRQLREFKDGRMKVQQLNGEEWPPFVTEANVSMIYPPGVPKESQFALGNPVFGMMPGLMMVSAIWLREHNRVAAVLKSHFPSWDDERLFQTSRNVLIMQTGKIVVEEYVKHAAGSNFQFVYKPELLDGERFQFQTRISVEFNLVYRWHALLADNFIIGNKNYSVEDFYFHPELAPNHGMKSIATGLAKTVAGEMGPFNHHSLVIPVIEHIVENGRELRLQSLNNYRRRFKLDPYKSFEDLVGAENSELTAELKRLYADDIDAVEFVVGLYVEKRRGQRMTPETMAEILASNAFSGLMSNPLHMYHRPSTYGGKVGMDLFRSTSLSKLFCDNLWRNQAIEECPYISFRTPESRRPSLESSKNEEL